MSDRTPGLSGALHRYFREVGYGEATPLVELRRRTRELGAIASMQISPEQAALLALLVRSTGARRILELGTFTGYSALAMALALPADGRLVTCEKISDYQDIARDAWTRADVSARIDLHIGRALDTLATLQSEHRQHFDLCFIDADKKCYPEYYEACLALVGVGGLIVIDNTLWGGSLVDDSDQRASTLAIKRLNRTIASDDRVEHVLLPFGDGLTLCRRCRAEPKSSSVAAGTVQ